MCKKLDSTFDRAVASGPPPPFFSPVFFSLLLLLFFFIAFSCFLSSTKRLASLRPQDRARPEGSHENYARVEQIFEGSRIRVGWEGAEGGRGTETRFRSG